MRHTHYTRVNTRTGEIMVAPFGPEDGARFKAAFVDYGYTTGAALLIVNRWNFVATIQPNPNTEWFFYLHTVEGAA